MGYRSKVIIGVEKKHQKKIEKILNKHELLNDMCFKEELCPNGTWNDGEDWKYYVGDYLKWYGEYDEVKEIDEFIEEEFDADCSAFIVCHGEDSSIHHEIGEWYDHCAHISTIKVDKKEPKSDSEKQLQWFNHFVDYINQIDSNKYNEACEYADNCESS